MQCVRLWLLRVGADNGSSLVVMSKGTRWQQQSYKVDTKFPYEWVKKKWAEKFAVTSIASCINDGGPCPSLCPAGMQQFAVLLRYHNGSQIKERPC